jgi:hypothetical protein
MRSPSSFRPCFQQRRGRLAYRHIDALHRGARRGQPGLLLVLAESTDCEELEEARPCLIYQSLRECIDPPSRVRKFAVALHNLRERVVTDNGLNRVYEPEVRPEALSPARGADRRWEDRNNRRQELALPRTVVAIAAINRCQRDWKT